MAGTDHYREAERILIGLPQQMTNFTAAVVAKEPVEGLAIAQGAISVAIDLAQVHATLALAAATAEAGDLVARPTPADETDSAYPGTAWGRALHGDLHLPNQKDS